MSVMQRNCATADEQDAVLYALDGDCRHRLSCPSLTSPTCESGSSGRKAVEGGAEPRLTAMLFVRMFKLIRMVKRGDKLPAEFRQEWLERNRELRKTANKLVAGVVADGKLLGDEAAYDGVAALFFPTQKEARAAEATGQAKDALSVVMDEKALFERTGATLQPPGRLKVSLTSLRAKDLTPAQFKEAALKGYAKA